MASQLKVDTLTGVTTAGSIVVTGEGNSTTTNLQQGLVKTWVNFYGGDSAVSVRDSHNIGSITDNGTGDYTLNFSNNMGNDDYAVTFMSGMKGSRWGLPIFGGLSGIGNQDSHSTSQVRVIATAPDDTATDNQVCNVISVGDLA